jgi:hypothetical protein
MYILNMITDKEEDIIKAIFKRIVPSINLSIQTYDEYIVDREFIIIGKLKYKQYDWLYININKIKPFQLKTFETIAKKKLPNRYIIKTTDEITRFIFK